MHIPYEEKLGHPSDFRVCYRFYTKEEGGRQTIVPYQGYRSDFWYPDSDHQPDHIFMIWPEFEDQHGNIILENTKSVLNSGTARMWVIDPEKRGYHENRIRVGLKGYFMEGTKRVAECEVIEITGLNSNPTSSECNFNQQSLTSHWQ